LRGTENDYLADYPRHMVIDPSPTWYVCGAVAPRMRKVLPGGEIMHKAWSFTQSNRQKVNTMVSDYWLQRSIEEKRKLLQNVGKPLFTHLVQLIVDHEDPDRPISDQGWADIFRMANNIYLARPLGRTFTAKELADAIQGSRQ
jgi:hypothetical protein